MLILLVRLEAVRWGSIVQSVHVSGSKDVECTPGSLTCDSPSPRRSKNGALISRRTPPPYQAYLYLP